ncbi:VOC family protein [Ruminococcus sp. OA3]|uniref:VOC family protein n=1 Tax=Ruminococcus sp. OA3 TaxID=2914164 RepID=UPI001F06A1F5|nr:VOC family protein [Ruminococcus sp. OA3]MCH1982054.1 VOC family protein [Ruminococcus sp. OA3]
MEWIDNVNGLQHIGIPASDIKRTEEFYKKLGFEPVLKTDNGGIPVVFLKLKELVLETYECESPAGCPGAIDHFAIDVKDLDEALAYVESLGVRILEPITQLPFWKNGVRYFIAEGPNQEKIEFAQYL